MSGGAYDYLYEKVSNLVSMIYEFEKNSPANTAYRRQMKAKLRFERQRLVALSEAIRAIEWNDSGDGDPTEDDKIIRYLMS